MQTTRQPKRIAGRRPKTSAAASDTRSQILAAARCVFARRGLDGASVREVAQKAKVNNAMIYYHFKDKVELYRAVLSESFAAFDRIWDHDIYSSEANARDKIQKYVEELIRFQHVHEELRRILSIELASCRRNYKWLGENLFKHSYQKLEAIVTEGIRRGEIRKIDPAQAIASLVGIVIHSFIMKPVAEYASGRPMELPVGEFGSFVTGMFFDGLGQTGKAGSVRKRVSRS